MNVRIILYLNENIHAIYINICHLHIAYRSLNRMILSNQKHIMYSVLVSSKNFLFF